MFIELLTILTQDALVDNVTNQITDNTMDLSLKQKYQSDTIAQIHAKYNLEEDLIRDEIDNLEDKTGDEYAELMEELQELKEMEDQEVKAEEEKASDYETRIQLENDNLETRKEAMEKNIEAFQEALDQSIEKNFGYFQ